ncbi:aspartate kinase [Tissierella creatinophila]|uniref:Aspartokinase n=1 Tax=Tissierella creatinophila DSM 6911 TaxID=1123403 RepID=A0A1U7M4X0_TISCR|nr:aspartate kinase [Tissierella creatinophila]OLS02357.1 aspartokinase 3 [Tissierella creatinophila DSM 6911]
METKVLKFGGSSLADSNQFKKVAEIIKSQDSRRYVIASAPGKRDEEDQKVTDLLYKCYILSENEEDIDEVFKKIENRYNGIIEGLGLDFSLKEEFDKIRTSILHHVGSDYVCSRGEYLNSMILAEYLGYEFIDAEKRILFLEDGSFDSEKTNLVLSEVLKDNRYAVIPGFYGSMPNGTIKTFSRGGSDITGSIVARAVDADLYENWTDVSGMLMADPRCVENPKVIDFITYKELRELSYMGASIMHEDAIFPVKQSGISINIRNTNAPEDNGTMIVPEVDLNGADRIVTGIAGKRGFSTINIEKDMMNIEIGFGRKILEVLENNNLAFEHLPTGIDTMSIIIISDTIKDIKEKIKDEIYEAVKADNVEIEDGLAMIAVVGRGMVKEKGTAMRIFSAIKDASINIRMIDQGSSEINIIIGVAETDYIPALKTIYSEFVE